MEGNSDRDTVYQSEEPHGVEEEGSAFDIIESELDDVDAGHDEGKHKELYEEMKRYEKRDDGTEVSGQFGWSDFGSPKSLFPSISKSLPAYLQYDIRNKWLMFLVNF